MLFRWEVLIFAIAFLVLLVFFLCYMKIYRKNINKKLEKNESTAHVSMISIENVGRIIIIVLSLYFVFSTLNELSLIKRNTDTMNSKMSGDIERLSFELDNLRNEVKEFNSPFTQISIEYGDVDTSDNTVKVKISCMPKTYSENTKIALKYSNKYYDFDRNTNGMFTKECSLPLFDSTGKIMMSVITDDVTSVYPFDNFVEEKSLFTKVLPDLIGDNYGFTTTKKEVKYEFNLTQLVDEGKFSDIQMISSQNGNEIEKKSASESESIINFTYPLNGSYDFVLTAKDSFGYIHKYVMYDDNWDDFDFGSSICDADGNCLYSTPAVREF